MHKHPLICTTPKDYPIITAENYEKWYSLFILHPDVSVTPVPPGDIMDMCDIFRRSFWVDHAFHPTLLLALAHYYGGSADIVTLETAAGRWVLEGNSLPNGQYMLEDEQEAKIDAFKAKEKKSQ